MIRTLLLGLAAAMALAAPAGAFEVTTYAVTVEGKGSYERHDESHGDLGKLLWTTDDRATFTFTGTIPKVLFYDDRVITGSEGDAAVMTVQEAVRDHVSYNADGSTTTGSCTGDHLLGAPTAPQLAPSTQIDDETGKPGIDLRLLDSATVDLDACTGGMKPEHHDMGLAGEIGKDLGEGPWDAFFDLPPEAVGMGKVIQLVKRQVVGDRCPFHAYDTQGCILTWEATITFTRTSQEHYPDGPVGPGDLPEPPAPPVPPLTPDEIPMPGDLTPDDVPLPKAARLSEDGRRASAKLTCPGGCTGKVVAKARGKVLGRTKVRLAAAPGPQRVAVDLARPAGRVRLAFTLRTGTGDPVRKTLVARQR